MNWGFCGLIDVILVVGALLALFFGFRKGFINKVISLVGFIAILIFCIFFCGTLSNAMVQNNSFGWYEGIKANLTNVVTDKLGSGDEFTAQQIIEATGVPGFISSLIANSFGNPTTNIPETCGRLAGWIMNIIAFGILFVAGVILILILKIIAKSIRNVKTIRVIDGVLGMALYAAIYVVAITGLFALLHCVVNWGWLDSAKEWLSTDMQLSSDLSTSVNFRISGSLYVNNFFVTFFMSLFGWA